MPWFRVDCGVREHPKTQRLIDSTGLDEHQALGVLMMLWGWAALYAREGGIRRSYASTVLKVIGVPSRPDLDLIEHLTAAGFLRRRGWGWIVNDFKERNGTHLNEAERKRKERAKKREVSADASKDSPRTVRAYGRTDVRSQNQSQNQSVPESSVSTSPASPAIGTDGCAQPGEAGTATATPPPDPGEVASLIAATAAAMGASVAAPEPPAPPDPLAELRNRALIARQLIDAGAYGIAAEQAREHIAAYEAARPCSSWAR